MGRVVLGRKVGLGKRNRREMGNGKWGFLLCFEGGGEEGREEGWELVGSWWM